MCASTNIKHSRRHQIAFILTVLVMSTVLLLIVGCTCSTHQTNQVTDNNVSLKLTTDKHDYELGKRVVVSARAYSYSSEPVSYQYGTGGKIEIFLQPVNESSSQWGVYLLEDGEITMAIPEWVSGDTLKPGETITRETRWDQELYTRPNAERIRAPAGKYLITASFCLNGQTCAVLKATLTIQIR